MLKVLTIVPILLLLAVVPVIVNQEITILEELAVEGTTEIDGALTAGDNVSAAGNLSVAGNTDTTDLLVRGGLTSNRDAAVSGGLSVGGAAVLAGTLATTGATTLGDTLSVAGATTVDAISAESLTLRSGSNTRVLTYGMFPIRGRDLHIGSITSTGIGERDITLPSEAMYRVFTPIFSTHTQDCIVVPHGAGLRVIAAPGGDCSNSTTVEIRYITD